MLNEDENVGKKIMEEMILDLGLAGLEYKRSKHS